jgi:hypothetical protein
LGPDGNRGEAGRAGDAGPKGPDGYAGTKGDAGKEGPEVCYFTNILVFIYYVQGPPGEDAQYCPCPPRG